MFEIKNYMDSRDTDLLIQVTTDILAKAQKCGVDLHTIFNSKSVYKN